MAGCNRMFWAAATLILLAGCHMAPRTPREQPNDYGPRTNGGIPTPEEWEFTRSTPPLTGGLMQHTFADIGDIYSPDISPDGTMLAFAGTQHSEKPNIYLKPLTGRSVIRKINDPEHAYLWPRFSRKGDLLAFAADIDGNWNIYMMAAGRNDPPVQITRDIADQVHPTWYEEFDDDGDVVVRKIAYSQFNRISGQWEIWALDLLTMSPVYICQGMYPVWSPDGARVAFQRARMRDTPWYSLWTVDVRNNMEREVVSAADWAAINPSWSPDGTMLAFATVHKSPYAVETHRIWHGDDIWLVDIDGSLQVQLTADVETDSNPVWSPIDGRIYFVKRSLGQRNIWSLEPYLTPDMRRR